MADLSKKIKDEVDSLIADALAAFLPDNIEPAITLLKDAWDKLPDTKFEWAESFLISKYITHAYFNAGQLQDALDWGILFNESHPNRDYGESEFMLAKIKHEIGELSEAKALFDIAQDKSGGRVWTTDKGSSELRTGVSKYFDFFNEK